MSDKKKKPQKLKARLPRGFADRQPADIRATDEMVAKIKAVYERYGFDPVETPMFEYTDALGKFLPDSDRPNEGVFSLTDDDDQWMSLRYDLTAPLARHVAENFNDIQLPYRTYRAGWVFRNEKPGPGRFRQFMQFDADTVGAPGVQADAEMCMMMADVMEALGLKGQYVIRVNNRKVLDGVLEAIGVADPEQKLTVLRAIDKLDKFGVEGVRMLLSEGRKDESGDFTKGAGLDERQINIVIALVEMPLSQTNKNSPGAGGSYATFNGADTFRIRVPYVFEHEGIMKNEDVRQGFADLAAIQVLAGESGYGSDRIRIDPSCVRGLEYYTGPVFEAELLTEIPNDKGEIVRFGSVGGGGRYDGLVSRFMGQPVPATGFSIGVSRLMTALKNIGKLGRDEVLPPVLVTVMDRDIEALGRYQRFTQDLRNAGMRAEMFQGNPKDFGKQLKYADRRGCPVAIIQGGDERQQGVVQIKDLIEGKRASEGIEDNAAWREARVAQVTVPEGELITRVREMLETQARERAADS